MFLLAFPSSPSAQPPPAAQPQRMCVRVSHLGAANECENPTHPHRARPDVRPLCCELVCACRSRSISTRNFIAGALLTRVHRSPNAHVWPEPNHICTRFGRAERKLPPPHPHRSPVPSAQTVDAAAGMCCVLPPCFRRAHAHIGK